MYIESIKNETILEEYQIIELKIRGKQKTIEDFFSVIQDRFDLAHDEWDESLNMLIMTFDYKPKEQTLNMIKRFTKEYIEEMSESLKWTS